MMCRNPARLATALIAPLLLLAAPAQSKGLFGKAPAAAKASPTTSPTKPVVDAAPRATPAERIAAERLDPLARAAFWAKVSNADAGDIDAAVKLASALRGLGRFDEAAATAERALAVKPDALDAMLEMARARIGGDRAFYAIEPLNRAAAAAPRDWRPHSLLGVALDQVKRPDAARAEYARALQLSPDNPAALANLGLLEAGQGDRAKAETLLRRAVAQPGATAQERADLALVLGLAGKVAEAEQLIRTDLPPELAEQNIAYLRAAGAPR